MAGEPVAEAGPQPSITSRIPVTLVVAVRDEESTIEGLIDGIVAQAVQPDEVVLVDGGSSDRTVEIARLRTADDPRYVVMPADGPATPGRGRNIGIAAARHDWIALTDAGVRLEPAWLLRLWSAHKARPQAGIVYGNFEFDTQSIFEECAAVAGGSARRWETPEGRMRRPAVVSCLVHRGTVEAVGGFPDLRSGEDMIFARRVEQLGIEAAWAPDATVWWQLRPDFASTFERLRLYSYHNALAGQQAYWHHPVARKWVPVGAGLVLGALHSKGWFAVAGVAVVGRAAVKINRHADGRGWWWRLRPDRAAVVTVLVVANDAAVFLGWWQARRASSRAVRTGHVPGPIGRPG